MVLHYSSFRFMEHCMLLWTYLWVTIVQSWTLTKLYYNCIIDVFLTDIWAIMAQTWYSAIRRLKQVVRWSNIASSDSALKFLWYRAILDQAEKDITLFSKRDITNVLHFNCYLYKFIALKFVANYLKIIHTETR